MKKLKFLVSLTNNDNDYQIEQASATNEAAGRLGVTAQVIYAGNDAITQSTQLLQVIQAAPQDRPDAILFEPVGSTALPQVARAAINAGIGWAILNREATYVSELRALKKAPIFTISADHVEIGRIQGRQFAALLPKGGSILYIQGPSDNSAAKDRTTGMLEVKPANIQVATLKGQWTEESAQKAVIDAIGAQDDSMAIGARKAFQEVANESDRERWLKLPFTGCDGLPKTGQAWVRSGLLAATVYSPPNTGLAIEMLVQHIQSGKDLPERALVAPSSIPALADLRHPKQ